ncbi:hypothetical protein ABZ807_12980 [Micromonospora sp. NPDC047548]|uniref:hypothetical protein n=1 Tax=Micromonospora sp. NPDC047548 TaxID=3155624 RepID=UPI0033DE9F36
MPKARVPARCSGQYADTIAWARRTGRSDLAERLTDLGPPPYADMCPDEPLLAKETGALQLRRLRRWVENGDRWRTDR